MRNNNAKLKLIILIFSFIAAALYSDDYVNFKSGVYTENIYVSIPDIKGISDISFSFGENSPAELPYSGGWYLSALPGEERSYWLNLKINEKLYTYKYLIDRRPPKLPSAEYVSDDAGSGYIFKNNNGNDIYFGYDDNSGEIFKWNGQRINIPASDFVYYFSEDKAGNRSDYSLLRPSEKNNYLVRDELKIKSPVEGIFSNTQFLYIEKKNFEWIKYSLNNMDPETSGVLYNMPVEIRRYGNVTIRIAAKPLNSDRIIKKNISYRVNTRTPLKNVPDSGVYSGNINLKSNLSGYRYCLEDRNIEDNDPVFAEELNINPVYGGVKYTVVRFNDNNDEGDYRYFYVIDDRIPANPIIECSSHLPEENKVTVNITGPDYSDIYYTIDGSSPGKSSKLFTKKFDINIPQNKNAGSIIIKAKAVSLNGKTGNVVSKIFTYDTQRPDKPVVDFIKEENSGIYKITFSKLDNETLCYKLADSNMKFFPVSDEHFVVDTPVGTANKFTFLFSLKDSSDNWSEVSDPVELTIDRTIPDEPVLDYYNSIIKILSADTVNYWINISHNGESVYFDQGKYTAPINLSEKTIPGSIIEIELQVIDNQGNYRNSQYSFYDEIEQNKNETTLFTRKPEDTFSGKEVDFFAYPDSPDEKLFYYLTDSTDINNPLTEGPFETDGRIVIQAAENERRDYLLEIFSVNTISNRKSVISSYEFSIDNKKPDMPELSGLKNNSTYNNRIILYPLTDTDSNIFLNIANSEEDLGQMFSNKSIIFKKPVVLNTEDGKTEDFYLKIGAGDSAGNSIVNENIYKYTIDKEPPEIKALNIEGNQLSLESEEAVKFYYEAGVAGDIIKIPTKFSEYFEDKLNYKNILENGKDVIFKVIAEDKYGNRSRYPLTYYISSDSLKNSVIEEPEIFIDKSKRKVTILWRDSSSDIFYKINDNEWAKYIFPASVFYQKNIEAVQLSYYYMGKNNNKSDTRNISIKLPVYSEQDLASGIKNNSFYNEDLVLKKAYPEKLIRYEITTEEILPPEVSVFSPVLPGTLPFKIEKGESINFIVSLKEFSDEQDKIGGAEQILRFTIDKQDPEPPQIKGLINGEYYLNDVTAYFEESQDIIFYSLEENGLLKNDFQEYTESIDIQSSDGAFNVFRINAYAEDYSGNKSAVKTYEITIDKEIIYVSNDGRDYFEGTRSKPFQTINKALEMVKRTNRKTVFIEEGIYTLNSSVIISDDVALYGGFIKGNWGNKSGLTEINFSDDFPETNPGLYVFGGNLSVNNMIFNNFDDLKTSLFLINKGNLNINNCLINFNTEKDVSIVKQDYGKIKLNNTEIIAESSAYPIINSEYGDIEFNNSTFTLSSNAPESTFIKIVNSDNFLLNSTNLKVVEGNTAVLFSIKNTNAVFKNNSVFTQNITSTSTFIETVSSKLSMYYNRLQSSARDRLVRAFVSEDSEISLSGNKFNLNAVSGIIGFNLTGGNSFFVNNSINIGDTMDFTYLFLLKDGLHNIETNIFNIGTADELLGFRTSASAADFLNNTFISRAGRNKSIMFKTENNSINRIINNIIVLEGRTDRKTENSILVYKDNAYKDGLLSLKNNMFYGWSLYHAGSEVADSIIKLDLIDNIYAGGSISDNFEEQPEITFSDKENFKISPESKCIDSGFNLKNIIRQNTDIDGEPRPNSQLNSITAYDIGADEYYQ